MGRKLVSKEKKDTYTNKTVVVEDLNKILKRKLLNLCGFITVFEESMFF